MSGLWLASIFAVVLCPSPIQTDEAALIAVAKAAVVAEVNGKPQSALLGKQSPRPVFVTIEIGGRVVGCRGGLVARSTSLEEEIRLAARSAAAHDPRYKPLSPKDLRDFQVTVTLVQGLEPITDVSNLRPEDGLVLTARGRSGIVLPWEGKDPKIRLEWAYRKAGLPAGTSAKLQRLKATRFKG